MGTGAVSGQLELFDLPSRRKRAFVCPDCGIHPWHLEEDGRTVHEDFYVHDELWEATCPDDAQDRWTAPDGTRIWFGTFPMCIGCFERRLDRRLTGSDFKSAPGNYGAPALAGKPPSKRFLDRWEEG